MNADETSPQPPQLAAQPRRPRRWLRVALALLIFVTGLVSGSALTVVVAVHRIRSAIQHPEEAPGRITERLKSRLTLTDEQAAKVEEIIRRHQAALQGIRREVQPRVEVELNAVRDEIAQLLSPAQRDKWDALYTNMLRNWMPPTPPAATHQPDSR